MAQPTCKRKQHMHGCTHSDRICSGTRAHPEVLGQVVSGKPAAAAGYLAANEDLATISGVGRIAHEGPTCRVAWRVKYDSLSAFRQLGAVTGPCSRVQEVQASIFTHRRNRRS